MTSKNQITESKPGLGEHLVAMSLNNPHFIIVICLVIIILGSLSLLRLPKDLLPAANLPAIQILSFYAGMPVEDVEKNLSSRFERYTGQAIGIERQESKSLVGVSIVKNFFGSNIDLNSAISQTTSLVMSVLRRLPPGTQPPLILPFDPMAAEPLALVAVSGNGTIEHSYDIARYDVRNAIQSVPGAMAPTVMGGTQREVVIYLDPNKLQQFNFSPMNVLDTLSHLNTFIPSGDVKIGQYDYQIVSNGLAANIADMNNFPLRADNGVTVLLNQIGQAKDAGQIQTNVVTIDGKQQVYVPIYRQPGGNSLQVVDQVKQAIAKLSTQLNGITLSVVSDQTIFIRHAINSIAEEALIGGGLAALMIFLFLANPRATFGIMLTLPLSLLIAILGLKITNQTINAMTLGGLALSIGVLVDNAIVVLENISKKLESDKSAYHAALEGASEVAMPVFASTLATLIVLFPVVFLSGIVKILFSALAISVMFAMIGSYFLSMTVMPLFARYFLYNTARSNDSSFFNLMNSLMSKMTESYGKALQFALHFRKRILLATLIFFMLGLCLTPYIGTELFPRADSGNLILNLRLPSGTRIEQTTAFSQTIEKQLGQIIEPHDLKMIIVNAGVYYGFPAAFTPNVGPQDVFFDVELTDNRQHTSQYYAKIIRRMIAQQYPQVEMSVQLGGLLTSALNNAAKAPIDVQFEGPSLQQMILLAQQLIPSIKKLPGAVDVHVQERNDAPIINLQIDRQKAMSMGITTEDVIKNVASAVAGSSTFDSSNIWVDPKTGIDYLMGVQFSQNQINNFNDLNNIPIRADDRNRTVPLNNVATLSMIHGPTQINHVNYKPVVDLYLDAQDRDIGGLSKDVQKILNNTHLPFGYTATIRGEIAAMNNAVNSLGGGFLLAAVLVYLVLVVQFRSFLLPSIIMTAVPLGLIGIILMLLVTHTYFSIQAAIGAIFMIGIAVANGVLLIEFITHHTKQNDQFDNAIIVGAKARLRPIIMTSLAAILGLVPMAIGVGHGAEANIPLGRAVIGGVIFSTLSSLFIVPILYRCIMQSSHRNQHQQRISL